MNDSDLQLLASTYLSRWEETLNMLRVRGRLEWDGLVKIDSMQLTGGELATSVLIGTEFEHVLVLHRRHYTHDDDCFFLWVQDGPLYWLICVENETSPYGQALRAIYDAHHERRNAQQRSATDLRTAAMLAYLDRALKGQDNAQIEE